MSDFFLKLAQELGVPYNGAWSQGVLNHDEAVASIVRLNGCTEAVAEQVLAALLPYTNDPGCNGMFYSSVAKNPGATVLGDSAGVANTCFVDLQVHQNNVWSFAGVTDNLAAVYCNGLVVAVIGTAPAGVGREDFISSIMSTLPPQLYGFMGFMLLLSQGEDGKVDVSIGLVDASGADFEWFSFDTVQTEYLAAKSLFLSGGAFTSLYLRAAMYGHVPLNGVLYESNDAIAEVLINLIDQEAEGVVDITEESSETGFDVEAEADGAEVEVADEAETDNVVAVLEDEGLEDELVGVAEHEDEELEDAAVEFTEIEETAFEEYVGTDGRYESSEHISEDVDLAVDLELAEETTYSSNEGNEQDERITFDSIDGLESVDFDEIVDTDEEVVDFGDVGISATDTTTLLGRNALVSVMRRAVADSDELVNLIIGEANIQELTASTKVSVAAICQIMADEYYMDDDIATFVIFANSYAVGGELRCDEAISAIASALWGNNAVHTRKRNLNHAAALLARHYDELWVGVYDSDVVSERLSGLGYSEALCSYVKNLMYVDKHGGPHGTLLEISNGMSEDF